MNFVPKIGYTVLIALVSLFISCTADIEPYEGEIPDNPAPTSLPTLSTTNLSNILTTSSTSGGVITADGGSAITKRGVVWNTSGNPTISNSKTEDGTGIGNFSSSITGLSANTRYYVRAYATNSNGTSYGQQISFTTATVTTVAPSLFMAGTFNGTQMSNMRPAWYGGAFGGLEEVDINYDYNYDRYLQLQGNGLNGLQMNIWIPEAQWRVGTYTLFDHDHYRSPSSNAWLIQNLPAVSSTDIVSGTITITEFNLTTKKIKGTFSFTYENFMTAGGPNQGPYQVTNGTFDYKLNDPYFN
ncbi:hypothetical protein NAT51_07675 [Flavobacterium amniphilum]|uniref:hypothetical protein n=1 Tax=Flavobacterium amniphilum TaxID=1834035 RepID=UPI002029DBB7|nr:hypothetical protein [Flavobacterium amniphilum]MCL9805396.1 hypothetical protein [Flavobacterium amniphilum]